MSLLRPAGGGAAPSPLHPPLAFFLGSKVLPSSLSSLLCLFACYVLSLLFTFSLSLSDVLNASSNKEFLSISLMPSSLQNYIFTAFRCRVALWTAQLETKHSSYIFGTVLSTKSISSSLMHLRISSLCVIPSHFSFHHLHALVQFSIVSCPCYALRGEALRPPPCTPFPPFFLGVKSCSLPCQDTLFCLFACYVFSLLFI